MTSCKLRTDHRNCAATHGPLRSHARAASVLFDPSTDNDEVAPMALANVEEGNSDQEDELSEVGSGDDKIKIKDNLEDAEDELEEGVQGPM